MILVDAPVDYTGMTKLRHKHWSHLVSDTSEDELHAFAKRLGLRRSWFQGGTKNAHYDVTPTVRTKAIKLGAIAVTSRELVVRNYDSSWKRAARRAVLAARTISPYDDGWLYECQ